jgi:hypothetical protein
MTATTSPARVGPGAANPRSRFVEQGYPGIVSTADRERTRALLAQYANRYPGLTKAEVAEHLGVPQPIAHDFLMAVRFDCNLTGPGPDPVTPRHPTVLNGGWRLICERADPNGPWYYRLAMVTI